MIARLGTGYLIFRFNAAADPLEIGCAELFAQGFHRGEHIKIGCFPVVLGFRLSLGKPPSIRGVDHFWMNSVGHMRDLSYRAFACFDDDGVAIFDTIFRCCF